MQDYALPNSNNIGEEEDSALVVALVSFLESVWVLLTFNIRVGLNL